MRAAIRAAIWTVLSGVAGASTLDLHWDTCRATGVIRAASQPPGAYNVYPTPLGPSGAPKGADRHQHGGDERHKAANGHIFDAHHLAALPQRNTDHGRQRGGGQQLGQGRHRRRSDGGLHRQMPQALAQAAKTLLLRSLCAMQAHHAVGEHVFLDHVGQVLGGVPPQHRRLLHLRRGVAGPRRRRVSGRATRAGA